MPAQPESAALYARLQEVLGPEPAATLMERLPDPQGLATKTDLEELRSELLTDIGEVKHRLTSIEGKLERVDGRFEKIDTRFEKLDDRLYDFHETLRSYARTFLVAQTATVFGVAGIVLGITQLL